MPSKVKDIKRIVMLEASIQAPPQFQARLLTKSNRNPLLSSGLGTLAGQLSLETINMKRISSFIRYNGRLGFAFLCLGVTLLAFAQPYEPVRLYDMIGDTMEYLGADILESLGDQNGDGFDDILMSVYDGVSHLRIMYGAEHPPYETVDFGFWHADTSTVDYYWGGRVFNTGRSTCADYTGDQIADILLDLTSFDFNPSSSSYLFIGGGGSEDFDTLWDWRYENDSLALLITGLGDFDANGTPDFTRGGVPFRRIFCGISTGHGRILRRNRLGLWNAMARTTTGISELPRASGISQATAGRI